MKALNTMLPWAWLIVNGHKRLELRSQLTKISGVRPIRATSVDKRWTDRVRRQRPDVALPSDSELRSLEGHVLGTAEFIDCRKIDELVIEDVIREACLDPRMYDKPLSYAWRVEARERFLNPQHYSTAPGAVIWAEIPEDVLNRCRSEV